MGQKFFFKILHQDRRSNARIGLIKTSHGEIETPTFIPVGTCGTVKTMSPDDLEKLGVQLFFVNTYHMYLSPGADLIEKFGGLHKFISWDKPLITDSGGFQVFSLNYRKIKEEIDFLKGKRESNLIGCVLKIDDDGVTFKSHRDGSIHYFTPEKSIEIQKKLGADIILCFDECTYYPATYEYTKLAMLRTHKWALRSLQKYLELETKKKNWHQVLYGIVQGGVFRDLREESAKFISSLPFEGIAIGGVSVGESKEEMRNVLDWTLPLLPKNKPRHLLGVGEIDDIFCMIERGIDTFDCVMPTRLGRMGQALVKTQNSRGKWVIDITKASFKKDDRPIEKNCRCYTCRHFSRAFLNHLFKTRELLGYRLLTYHNLYFINKLLKEIKIAIRKGKFEKLKKEWLNKNC